jgi:hypothetical protein
MDGANATQAAIQNALNSLQSSGKGKELHKASARCVNLLQEYKAAIKEIKEDGQPVPARMTKLLQTEEARYKQLGLIAAKVDSGSLEVMKYLEDAEFFDPDAHKAYIEAEKLCLKDKKRRLEASGGGSQKSGNFQQLGGFHQHGGFQQHGGGFQPQGGGFQQRQFQGGGYQQRQFQGGGFQPQQQQQQQGFGGLGPAGRGATATRPSWMTHPNGGGGGGGGATFHNHAAGLRLKSASGKMVHFPGDRNLAAAPHSAGAGGSFPNSNTCWFCGTVGHEAYECGQLRGYFADGKVDVQGPQGEFPL